ncbi:RNA-directed DNA polymerase, eukaryota, reverse transcriptase zinc-binding domain protein [Tanacetum coccineum]
MTRKSHVDYGLERCRVIMGDFNVVLFIADTFHGLKAINISMRDLNERVNNIEIAEVNNTGSHYTWNQKPKGKTCILKKIDQLSKEKPKPFKFYNFLVYKPDFLQVVSEHWVGMEINGYNLFKLVKKMKFLKKPLRKLLHLQGNNQKRVVDLRHELDEVQKAL